MNDQLPRILIVDDVPENVMLLGHSLGEGFDIQFATSGREALSLIEQQRPDLILLDVLMPDISGMQVLDRLRTRDATADIPVVMISSDGSEQRQLAGFESGADDYLTKPVLARVLRARVRNLLQRRQSERELRLAAHVFRHCGEAMMVTDHSNCILEVNPAFTRMTGYTAEEVRGCNPSLLASGITPAAQYESLWAAVSEHGYWQGEIWDRHKDGYSYPKMLTITVMRNMHGGIDYHIATFADIRHWKEAEQRIQHQANHDPLTGLANRLLLTFTLEHALQSVSGQEHGLALMMIDLDRFKEVNDSLGHAVGDGLLVEVASRLTENVRQHDLVARLGGDEFVVLLNGGAPLAVAQVAGKLNRLLAEPFEIQGHQLHISASIGICLCWQGEMTADEIMHNADLALYDAKARGRNNYQFFRQELNQQASDRQQIEHCLRQALDHAALRLGYQPQFDAAGQICAVEVLPGWGDDLLGRLGSQRLLSVAEDAGLMLQLGYWMLDEACRNLQQWRAAGACGVRLLLPVALSQLRNGDFISELDACLRRHQLAGHDLELLLSERQAAQGLQVMLPALQQLDAGGVAITLDDFGAEGCSLVDLRMLPLRRIRLQRSFVAALGQEPDAASLCAAAIAVAHAMGLQAAAATVDCARQRDVLMQQGCDQLQGELLARVQDAEGMRQLLAGMAAQA